MTETKRSIDKSAWPSGTWHSEPDRVEFVHAGFACLANRSGLGNWCGYVAVPREHPYYGRDYDSFDVDVHGGLTYAAPCTGEICHVPAPGMPDDVWWLGFDCAHSWDLIPHVNAYIIDGDGIYRDLPYVRGQIERLAEQLADVRPVR